MLSLEHLFVSGYVQGLWFVSLLILAPLARSAQKRTGNLRPTSLVATLAYAWFIFSCPVVIGFFGEIVKPYGVGPLAFIAASSLAVCGVLCLMFGACAFKPAGSKSAVLFRWIGTGLTASALALVLVGTASHFFGTGTLDFVKLVGEGVLLLPLIAALYGVHFLIAESSTPPPYVPRRGVPRSTPGPLFESPGWRETAKPSGTQTSWQTYNAGSYPIYGSANEYEGRLTRDGQFDTYYNRSGGVAYNHTSQGWFDGRGRYLGPADSPVPPSALNDD